MKYTVKKTLHSDFSVMELGKLPGRAYFIPCSDSSVLRKTCFKNERASSDMVRILSGTWDFKFYKKASAMPDVLNTKKIKFDTVSVPSVWQRTGYLPPVYLNCPYECKTLAPEVPADMPAAVYRKLIAIDTPAAHSILTFLGVSSNISLYVNGAFIGYSEGSHNSAEFDVTDVLHAGENEIVVLSWKWCSGTFLEAQDMFRENGIFRDVYLTEEPDVYLWDYEVRTEKGENGYTLTLDTVLKGNTENSTVKALLCKEDTVFEEAEAAAGEKIVLSDLSVDEWSAEIPNLYRLYIIVYKNGEERMAARNLTGFRTIEIKGNVFLFNGQPIKIKGVNHHDDSLYNGYAMTKDEMIRDVEIMKNLNVNAVRTSHYPPDPFFLQLADAYGLYIIDEADIETHGCSEMFDDVSYLSRDEKWAPRYIDRVRRMYMRDRSHPSILMWSLGNESGGCQNHDKCYTMLKETGTVVPVHYEGISWAESKHFYYDVISEMYTNTYTMEQMAAGKRKKKIDGVEKVCKEYNKHPFFLCEYCHAMGVGPGNLEEYWELIYANDGFMGGCIWEWADHTVSHEPGDAKYPYRYTYGGDHGEKQHDGHFCVDGLLYADRTPHTGALEMKQVYRPVRASLVGRKVYCFKNTNRFRNSSYLRIVWSLLINGEEKDKGELSLSVAPMSAERVEIPHCDPEDNKDAHINFTYYDGDTEVATEQITLQDVAYEYDIEIGSKIAVTSDNGIVTIYFENGETVFDGRTGAMIRYFVNGKEFLNTAPVSAKGWQPNVFRALIDNDSRHREEYLSAGLDSVENRLHDFRVTVQDGEIDVLADFYMYAKNKPLYGALVTYTFTSLGAAEIFVSLRLLDRTAPRALPRFGLMCECSPDMRHVRYYGRGAAENMPDFKAQSPVGIYEANVVDMTEPYVFPQDNGNHGDTKWLELTDKDGRGIRIFAEDRLSFSVHPYTQQALQEAQHQEDLCDMNTTVLSIDGYVRGIGSSSCGPDTRDEYSVSVEQGYTLAFTVIPV